MAPSYSRNQNRRQNRTVDHDIYEGLPVRQWRRDYVTVAPPPEQDNTASKNNIWAVELPHGMPRDSHLLPQHSQDLLRAARSGRLYKRPLPVEEEEADADLILGEKTEKKDEGMKDKGFTAKAWKQIPRHLEGPDVEYLAKRRKGLVTVTSKAAHTGSLLTNTSVKRIDAAGNEYIQNVVIPQGQAIEGEVISQTIIANPISGDGLLAPVPTPIKRKPMQKKKKKGPGRGKKGKMVDAPTSVPEAVPIDGLAASEASSVNTGVEGVKVEKENSATPTLNEDTEMADGSARDSDEEGDDAEEGDEEEEGEEPVDVQDSPSKPSRPLSTPPSSSPVVQEPSSSQLNTEMSGMDSLAQLPPLLHVEHKLELKTGSPLKNIALTTSAVNSPLESPKTVAPFFPDLAAPQAPIQIPEVVEPPAIAAIEEVMQTQAVETAPPALPIPPPEPTVIEAISSAAVLAEEEEEEEMLLDIIENANNANIGVSALEPLTAAATSPLTPVPEQPATPQPEHASLPPVITEVTEVPAPEEQPEEAIPPPVEAETTLLLQAPVEPAVIPPAEETKTEEPPLPETQEHEAPPPEEDDDDDFPDLLGNLEAQLN